MLLKRIIFVRSKLPKTLSVPEMPEIVSNYMNELPIGGRLDATLSCWRTHFFQFYKVSYFTIFFVITYNIPIL